MSAKILNFKTDFTMFLLEKTRQTIKVVTDNEIVECNGVILSQHSQTLKKMIEEDEELFLLGYQSIWDILVILYGGSVVLKLDNCLEMIKFGWEFGVPSIADQAFDFMESVANKCNIVHIARLCLTAMKLTRFYDVNIEEDVFWPCEKVIANLYPVEVDNFVKNFLPIEIVKMFKNKTILAQVIDPLSKRVTKDNVEGIIGALQEIDFADLVAAISCCAHDDAAQFFKVIQEHCVSPGYATFFVNIKKLIFREIGNSLMASLTSRPDINAILKHWKTYGVNQMIWRCQHGMPSFWLMEIILSLVSFLRPRKRDVKRLCRFINSSTITLDYARHAISIFMHLGYDVSSAIDVTKCYTNLTDHHQVAEISEIKLRVFQNKDSGITSVLEKKIIFSCNYANDEWMCAGGSIDITEGKDYVPNITCVMSRRMGSSTIRKFINHSVYAKTVDGK